MNTTFGCLYLAGQDSWVLQMLDLANCAVAAAGHHASSWNRNGTKQSPYEDGRFLNADKRRTLNSSIMTNACERN